MNDHNRKASIQAKEAVYRLLKFRLRSEKEIRDKLKQKGFSSETIKETVAYFKFIDLLNDRVFTKAWISSRLAKPFGVKRIAYELKSKGIDQDIIEEELEQLSDSIDEESSAITLARKRARQYTKLEKTKARQRLYGYLSRRGFNPHAINKALKEL